MNIGFYKILLICGFCLLLISCATEEKKKLSDREREALEEEAYLREQQARDRMVNDGFGVKREDGTIIWKDNTVKKKFKILNRDQLNRGRNKKKKPDLTIEP